MTEMLWSVDRDIRAIYCNYTPYVPVVEKSTSLLGKNTENIKKTQFELKSIFLIVWTEKYSRWD